jgi:GNAT superfamily N-acetyltransferase
MKIEIRRARRGDLALLVQLLAEMDGERPPQPARAVRLWNEMARYPDYRCFLAFDGKTPVGTFSLLIFPALVHGGAYEALLDGVVVTASRRGLGIGSAMMSEAMRLARDAGCYKLALSSSLRRGDAHRFYRSLGFEPHGVSFHVETGPAARQRAAGSGLVPAPD